MVCDTLVAFLERAFVEPAPEPDRARIRAEALAEADAAELEIQADGNIVSRTGASELYRIRLATSEVASDLSFEKAPGEFVTLRLLDDGNLLAVQTGKPDLTFARQTGQEMNTRAST
jgi:hypothetical protein